MKFPWKATKQRHNKKQLESLIRFQLVRLRISISEENILACIAVIDVLVIFQMCRGFYILYTLWKFGIFDVIFLSMKGALTFKQKRNQTQVKIYFRRKFAENPVDFWMSQRRHKTSINELNIFQRSNNFFFLSRKRRRISFSFWQSKCNVTFRPCCLTFLFRTTQGYSEPKTSIIRRWVILSHDTKNCFSAGTCKQQVLRKRLFLVWLF